MADLDAERLENIIDWYKQNQKSYSDFAETVLGKIRKALEERNIFIAYSCYRAKDVDSLREKCQKTVYDKQSNTMVLKYKNPKNEITDFAGVRIVAYLKSDISPIKEIVEKLFSVDWDNSGDKAEILADNQVGYLSMHYVVSLKNYEYDTTRFNDYKCEIQIRTVLQDAWAQIFHDRQYKTGVGGVSPKYELKRETGLLAGTLELIDKQIDGLVREYDSMNAEVFRRERFCKVLDSNISERTLIEYCRLKFDDRVSRFYNVESTLSLLHKYGFKLIREIDNIVEQNFVEKLLSSNQTTIDKTISYILIIHNPEKYFSLKSDDTFKTVSAESAKLIRNFVDIDDICKKYSVIIESE